MKTDERNVPDIEEPRRRALLKLGAYAAFSAPAITTLLVANKATAQSVQTPIGGIETGPGGTDICIGGDSSCD